MENQKTGLLNVNEAAARLGLSEHTIRRYVLERRLPYVKLGASVRFDPAELEQFISDRRVPRQA